MAYQFEPGELERAPKITVAGKEYPVPKLSPRQNKRIVARLDRLQKKIMAVTAEKPLVFTEEDVEDLYLCVYWALTRTMPELQERDFMDWPIELPEALLTIPIIAKQTGMMVQAGGPGAGEASAGTGMTPTPPESTGTG